LTFDRGDVTGPAAALRGGVEFFRTTSIRVFAFAEVFLPIFWADDQQAEVVTGSVPSFLLAAGSRF